jgi:membrane fusion protein (multidrug efflux system)
MNSKICLSGSARLMLSALACSVLAACSNDSSSTPARSEALKVGVVTVTAADLPITIELSGRSKTRVSAEIRPQVGGVVQGRLFEEGAKVSAGQVLYQLDPATYKAAYESAKAAVAKAEATYRAAEVTARRNEGLARIDAVSQQTADDSKAASDEAKAALDVAKAEEDTARINLGYTRIVSPISGRIDVSTVSQGALVTVGQTTALTTVRQLDPLVIDVKQSSAEILRLREELRNGRLRGRGQEVPVRLILEDGSEYAHPGKLQFDGVSVDESTGMVTLRALVPNPDGVLLPGMYVRAVVEEGEAKQAIVVPQQGVSRKASGGATALVVDKDGRVAERKLTLGRAVGNQWLVTSGLKVGEQLVVEGANKVSVGDQVTTLAAKTPAASAAARN